MALFKDHKVRIQKILELIPEDLLFRLAKDTKVDYCAKVLFGERIFNLLLYGILTTERTSQRVLEDLFESDLFKTMFSYTSDMKIARSSISTRLSVIDPARRSLLFARRNLSLGSAAWFTKNYVESSPALLIDKQGPR